jgi:O-antigen ligase
MMIKSKRPAKALLSVVVLAAAVWILLPPEQKARFAVMGDDPDSITRMTYWKRGMQLMAEHPVAGIGYKNWHTYNVANRWFVVLDNGWATIQEPHNIFVEAGAELGVTGLLIFCASSG